MTQKRKHANLIKKWADNKDIKIEIFSKDYNKWVLLGCVPNWFEDVEYREYDPYRELKEAYAQGKIIQHRIIKYSNIWEDILNPPNWNLAVHRYRIKPEIKVGSKVITSGYSPTHDGKILTVNKISKGQYCYFDEAKDHNFDINCARLATEEEIKASEPKYIPFTYADAEMLIGKPIKSKISIRSITGLRPDCVEVSGLPITYGQLFSDYTFLDGSQCGKLKE